MKGDLHLHPEHDLPDHVTETIRLMGKKWALVVLHTLSHSPASFGELKTKISGISASVLSDLLSEFTKSNLVEKRSTGPNQHMYFIGEFGPLLCELVDNLDRFGMKMMDVRPSISIQ